MGVLSYVVYKGTRQLLTKRLARSMTSNNFCCSRTILSIFSSIMIKLSSEIILIFTLQNRLWRLGILNSRQDKNFRMLGVHSLEAGLWGVTTEKREAALLMNCQIAK